MAEAVAQEAKRCAAFLGQVAKDMQAQGVNVKVECAEGSPAREIINFAKAQQYGSYCHGQPWQGRGCLDVGQYG